MKKNVLQRYLLQKFLLLWMVILCLGFTSCEQKDSSGLAGIFDSVTETQEQDRKSDVSVEENQEDSGGAFASLGKLSEYSGKPYIVLNGNQPGFTEKDKTEKSFEKYSKLDSLGRCGVAYANVGKDLMPTEERGSISKIKPTGWHTAKYANVDGRYLYNRCHLIGYQLTAENANRENLITGTRYMNVDGMLAFENMVADYVKETNNHVLYRVTPIFEGKDLLARGVQIEAYSVEDDGDGICFNVFVYNVQPGIYIDYADGDSREESDQDTDETDAQENAGSDDNSKKVTADKNARQIEIRGNKRSRIYHCPGQAAYEQMADSNHLIVFHSEQEAQDAGYRKAKR